VRFGYDAQRRLHHVDDGQRHHFAHPSRAIYYVDGLAARGRHLHDEYLLSHVPFEAGDKVIECGAYDGDFALALQHARASVHLTSFEPSPVNAPVARRNLGASPALLSADLREAALWSDGSEKVSFHLKTESADSSLVPIEGATGTVEVVTARLDEAIPAGRYKLLKLEAEGAEPEVLEGAKGVLSGFAYIAADLGFERGVRQESTLPQVVNALLHTGFEVAAVGRPRLVVLFRNTAAP